MIERPFTEIFRKGSRTYYYSTLFFPSDVKRDIYVLYGFVRLADNFVDAIPQEGDRFHAFVDRYRSAREGAVTGDLVIDSFQSLAARRGFDPRWVDAFLRSMEMDLSVTSYATEKELETYLYGSAEVIGLMMARILSLPPGADVSARCLGRGMQYINFIRDIAEDLTLGREYFPGDEMAAFGLDRLDEEYTRRHPVEFRAFVRHLIGRYRAWDAEGELGYRFIPHRYLGPIRTAAAMYRWTARVIELDPFIVYHRKVKPSVPRIVATMAGMTLDHYLGSPSAMPLPD